MAKLIIWIPGKPNLHGFKRREFLWSESHKCYLYEGKEIDIAEFNVKYEKAMKTNYDMNPRVKVIDAKDSIRPPAPSVQPTLQVSSMAVSRSLTLDEAEAVVQRLAPERLKKKTGPKPHAPVMEVA